MAEEKAKKQANPAVIQAIKAIAVLVVICLVCVLLLALCNDLLYIDDDTRLSRAMQKVYKDFALKEEKAVVAANATNDSYGKVNRVLLSKDGTYVIEALGTGGYQGGSVTLYVVIGADAKIKGWAVKENDKQSYIDRIPSTAGTTWYVGKEVSNELELEMTGATVKATSTAINNAVNMAAYYARTALGLGNDPTGEATNAILALLAENGIEGYEFSNSSSTVRNIAVGEGKLNEYLAGDDTWSFTFIGVADDGSSIAVHVFNWNDTYKFDSLDGIPASTKIVAVKMDEVVAKHNVDDGDAMLERATTYPLYYVGGSALYAYVVATSEDAKTYTVVAVTPGYVPQNYTLTIIIETDEESGLGKVVSVEIATSGFEPGAPSEENAHALLEGLKGATLATIDDLYESGKVSGATQSANLITAAVRAALAHYDANLASAE